MLLTTKNGSTNPFNLTNPVPRINDLIANLEGNNINWSDALRNNLLDRCARNEGRLWFWRWSINTKYTGYNLTAV